MSSNPSASPSLAHRLSHSILTWVIGAILLALFLGSIRFGGHPFVPKPVGNVFATFSDLFSQFLSFSIPLIIIGLVTPAIADLGRGAGKWLGITTALAYASTLFAGFLTFVVCAATFPRLLAGTSLADVSKPEGALSSYFTVEMPPAVEVMTALLLSFVLGIGLSMVPRGVLRKGFIEFRAIITRLIERLIIPLLPLHIFGIFLNLTYTGAAGAVMKALLRVVVVVLILEVVILGIQFLTAGLIGRRNPLKALLTMLPAYLTALGTSSSAATIPVTLRQTKKNGVSDAVASFTIPPVRHDPPGRVDLEDLLLRLRDRSHPGPAREHHPVDRLHLHARHHDGGRSGRARGRHHGGHRSAVLHARLQRPAGGPHDRHLHRPGLLRYRHERHR